MFDSTLATHLAQSCTWTVITCTIQSSLCREKQKKLNLVIEQCKRLCICSLAFLVLELEDVFIFKSLMCS